MNIFNILFQVMTMIIDPNIIKNPCGAPLLAAVQQADIKVEIQAQVIPNLITLWREVVQVKDTGDKVSGIENIFRYFI